MPHAHIQLTDLGKSYNYRNIFSGINMSLQPGKHYAIKGANGSGKSTLLQCIAGFLKPTEGSIKWSTSDGEIPAHKRIDYFSFSAPYMELIEEYTIEEHLALHAKRWASSYNPEQTVELLQSLCLEERLTQPIKRLSSGQKQKVNLLLALAQNKPVLILDEPTSFLDADSMSVYQTLLDSLRDTTIIVASNQEADFARDSEILEL